MDLLLFLKQLTLRPQDFFKEHMKKDILNMPFAIITIFLFLFFWWVDRAEKILIKSFGESANPLYADVAANWSGYWLLVLLGWFLAGGMMYLIGGWFYGVRVRWSKWKLEWNAHRNIYVYSFFFVALANMLVAVGDTFTYSSPGETYLSEDFVYPIFESITLIFLFLTMGHSLFISYKWVMLIEWVRKLRAIIWFIVLPALMTISTIILMVSALILAGL